MSRRVPSFASQGMFDVLGTDDDVEDVEEEELEEPIQTTQPSESTSASSETTVLSKSAKKRLAKANRAASASGAQAQSAGSSSAESAKQSIPTAKEVQEKAQETVSAAGVKAQEAVNGAKELLDNALNGNSQKMNGDAKTNVQETISESITKAQEALGLSGSTQGNVSPRAIGSSFTPPTSTPYVPSTDGPRKSSFSQPPSTKFAPNLPKDLPEPQGDVLPTNRKRNVPDDFTPKGSRAEGSKSPNKPGAKGLEEENGSVKTSGRRASESGKGVKFEDGIQPGEGKEGETTIVPKANRNMVERTVMTFVMIAGFILLLCAGHPFMIVLVLLCQTLVYKEVTALFELRDAGQKKTGDDDRWSKTLNWYFFVVTNYFLYGESIIYYFKHIVFVDSKLISFAQNHRFISFMLYVLGFVGFVANLNKKYLRQQFALFCWVHITLLLIVVSSHFIVNNILEGLIWFFVPASLVICNDVMAYVCGKAFGRTPLIKLSPKKTVEGFLGAFICTLLFALLWGTFFMRFPYMTCPARDLGTNAFSTVTCRPNPVFVWRDYEFTGAARKVLETVLGYAPSIPYAPFQIHCLVMATFASLVAPFGGFFASGFKRAFNVKDFGDSIPGHGGMTDRMDCQFMMGLFAYVYYSSMIRIQFVSPGSIMQTVVTSLSAAEQLELLADLKKFLEGQGVRV